jgi:hypothetical protein
MKKKFFHFLKKIARIVDSHHGKVVIGVIVVIASIFDVTETTIEKYLGVEIEAEYGIIIFGFAHILKGITDAMEGAESIETGLVEKGKR